MPTTIYDSSQLTKRRAEKAIAGSFLTRLYPPNLIQPQTGYGPLPGIYDSSVMYAVKTGHMTEYTRYPACIGISPGCPCPELNASISTSPFIPAIPGAVSGITFTVGSIVISWIAPIGDGPFTYLVTPYLNGIAQTTVTTNATTYRFTDLQEWQPYTFTVCAMNAGGQGPIIPSTTYFLSPPSGLSTIMNGGSTTDIVPSLKYVINAGLDTMLQYAATVNIGPTRGSRIMYVWTASVAQAWRWVSSQSRITGLHDTWDWTANKAATSLSDSDSIIWLCNVIDFISPYFVGDKYKSIYNCPAATVTRVKAAGEWDRWTTAWQTWYTYRVNDGSVVAATLQPNSLQNPNINNPLIIDGTTVNDINAFPSPTHWTALWLKGIGAASQQKYLTYTWDNVKSTCLTEVQEAYIQATHLPLTGDARDAEVDVVKGITANLTDAEKCCAEFWAGGPGTVSPPLMFIWFWKEYMRSTNVGMADKQNIMYSLLDLAIHLFEGGRVTWRLKSAYMEDRPIQEIRRRYVGQQIESWNGSVDGSQWTPYQTANFVTPPFADFPSGHSHFSTAFALTMNKWFNETITQTPIYYDKQTLICPLFTSNATQAFGTFTIAKGKSEIEPDVCPAQAITFNYGTWNDMSNGILGAGVSRLYGGIHCDTANTSSQSIAEEVNKLINDPFENPNAWNIQTA
jgi:hypothetical protein